MNAKLSWALRAAVAISALAGIGMVVVLLRGDPTYLVQPHTRGGAPWGQPAPISFGWRAILATVVVVGLVAAGWRAVTDAAVNVRLQALLGYAFFAGDVVAWACIGPAFPAYLADAWLVFLLLGIVYSEAIADLCPEPAASPPWIIWGLCVLGLAARLSWTLFSRAPIGS